MIFILCLLVGYVKRFFCCVVVVLLHICENTCIIFDLLISISTSGTSRRYKRSHIRMHIQANNQSQPKNDHTQHKNSLLIVAITHSHHHHHHYYYYIGCEHVIGIFLSLSLYIYIYTIIIIQSYIRDYIS